MFPVSDREIGAHDASTDPSDDAYGEITALRYSTVEGRPSEFAMQAAPWIWQYFDHADIPADHRRRLDVGCGTGDLAAYLLNRGVELTGLTSYSPHVVDAYRSVVDITDVPALDERQPFA